MYETVPPGVTLAPPSLLLKLRPGAVVTGVVSPAPALVAPAPIVALLEIWVVPAGTGPTTVTANVAVPPAPPARLPIVRAQAVPAGLPPAQLQPAVLAAALKV